MLKNWTAQLDTSAIRVSSHFSLLFQFLLSLFFTLAPIQKFHKLSLSLPTEHASESLSLMPQKKATSDALVTSPPKNECEPTVFQLPTQM